MKCTDVLIQEHKVIMRALDVLGDMAERVQYDQPVAARDVQTLLRFLRAFADDNHQLKEESALFPELMRSAAVDDAGLRHMLFEHDQERSLVEAIENALLTKQGAEFVLFANRLSDLIRNHIDKEDNVLFDIVERALTPEQDEVVTAALAKFEIDPGLMSDLRKLEWTYLRKVA